MRATIRCFVVALISLTLHPFRRAQVVHLVVDDTIQPISAEYISRGIDAANARHADAVLIDIAHPWRSRDLDARNRPEDPRLAHPSHRLCLAEWRTRRFRRILHPRIRRCRRHGSRNQYRSCSSGNDGRRQNGRRHEGEGHERCLRVHSLILSQTWPQRADRRKRSARIQILHRPGGACKTISSMSSPPAIRTCYRS